MHIKYHTHAVILSLKFVTILLLNAILSCFVKFYSHHYFWPYKIPYSRDVWWGYKSFVIHQTKLALTISNLLADLSIHQTVRYVAGEQTTLIY